MAATAWQREKQNKWTQYQLFPCIVGLIFDIVAAAWTGNIGSLQLLCATRLSQICENPIFYLKLHEATSVWLWKFLSKWCRILWFCAFVCLKFVEKNDSIDNFQRIYIIYELNMSKWLQVKKNLFGLFSSDIFYYWLRSTNFRKSNIFVRWICGKYRVSIQDGNLWM